MTEFQKLLKKGLNPQELAEERRNLIRKIQDEHKRKLMLYASDSKKEKAPILLNHEDITVFSDLIESIKDKDKVSVLIHSPGGYAEVAEMVVKMLRSNFKEVDFIIPRFAKSAATMMVCSGEQILMDYRSELGPIDPQIPLGGRRFAADAFSEGFKKILKDTEGKRLNPAYLPVLQKITPADIQAAENAKNLSCSLVKDWLKQYMFKDLPDDQKEAKAKDISDWLGDHNTHLSHGRPITLSDAQEKGMKIVDYGQYKKLSSYIWQLYCNIELSFDLTNAYKMYETESVQLIKVFDISLPQGPQAVKNAKFVNMENKCDKCNATKLFQLNFQKGLKYDNTPYPKDDKYICDKCGNNMNLKQARLQAEGIVGKKSVFE